jgi:amino acid transporter
MDPRIHVQKNIKITSFVFSTAFTITLILCLELNYVRHSPVYYLGLATIALLFPFLLSIAYVMAIIAKRALDKGIKINEEEFEHQNAEMSTEEKENDQ